MTKRSPRKLRTNLEAARARIRTLIGVLQHNADERRWGVGEQCTAAVEKLNQLLDDVKVPDEYKVAVIGRFKAGKSSFVNELLGERLASADTNPETAAVTTFRNGPRIKAKIRLISKEDWEDLKKLYAAQQTDPAAHRVARWMDFSKTGDNRRDVEKIDLEAIEAELIKPGGKEVTFSPAEGRTKDAARKEISEFRKTIKQFTSSTKPHHCLVETINIETPSKILSEGVTLIDTPGLDDTERYRVQLTERAVEDIDAILFLTKSGASYGQAEKDFLLRLLRKGHVKQMLFVVTQVDHTYEQHANQASDDDEDPQPISKRIAEERTRLNGEIQKTFDELVQELGDGVGDRYREQLGSIDIEFTSAQNHRDHLSNRPIRYPISPDDPGGLRRVEKTLFDILSSESRLASARRALHAGSRGILADMIDGIEKRRARMTSIRNSEVAEEKLLNFRRAFEEHSAEFVKEVGAAAERLKEQLKIQAPLGKAVAELAAISAEVILRSYETDDAARHWRTRRSGRWGMMNELQNRVANQIFPRVANHLRDQTKEFEAFVEEFRNRLSGLSDRAATLFAQIEIGAEFQIDIQTSLQTFLDERLESLQESITSDEERIVSMLDDFVSKEVDEKISKARDKVADVWGTGTTWRQVEEVKTFYDQIRAILKSAVQTYVEERFRDFSKALIKQARLLPEKSVSHISAQIDGASSDIKTATSAALDGEREEFLRVANMQLAGCKEAVKELDQLVGDYTESVESIVVPPSSPAPSAETERSSGAIKREGSAQTSQNANGSSDESEPFKTLAKTLVARYSIAQNETGWPYDRIFLKEHLLGATRVWISDPFLALAHQRRNLVELISVIGKISALKVISIRTREISPRGIDADKKAFYAIDQDIRQLFGARLTVSYDEELHDRFIVFDNGVVFKLGRGLDIYMPASGMAINSPRLRKTKACEIDVFRPEE